MLLKKGEKNEAREGEREKRKYQDNCPLTNSSCLGFTLKEKIVECSKAEKAVAHTWLCRAPA